MRPYNWLVDIGNVRWHGWVHNVIIDLGAGLIGWWEYTQALGFKQVCGPLLYFLWGLDVLYLNVSCVVVGFYVVGLNRFLL